MCIATRYASVHNQGVVSNILRELRVRDCKDKDDEILGKFVDCYESLITCTLILQLLLNDIIKVSMRITREMLKALRITIASPKSTYEGRKMYVIMVCTQGFVYGFSHPSQSLLTNLPHRIIKLRLVRHTKKRGVLPDPVCFFFSK